MTRFYDVKHGSIRIDGHDVRDLTLASLRANVGVVLDEPFLFSASVRDNIAYGRPTATLDEVEAAAKAAGAHEFIAHLADGYDTVVGERGYTLSGGQRQRIAIARTLLVNPPIMVLDDATSAIDVQVEQRIHAGLRVQMEGRTTLIIAHRLSTISLADRVVLLDQHKVVADGTHAELLETHAALRRGAGPGGRVRTGGRRRGGRAGGRAGHRRGNGRARRPAAARPARFGAGRRPVMMFGGGGWRRLRWPRRSAGLGRLRPAFRRHPPRAAGRGGQAAGHRARVCRARHRLQPERLGARAQATEPVAAADQVPRACWPWPVSWWW